MRLSPDKTADSTETCLGRVHRVSHADRRTGDQCDRLVDPRLLQAEHTDAQRELGAGDAPNMRLTASIPASATSSALGSLASVTSPSITER